MSKFVIKPASNGQNYFVLKSTGNNETILTSEMYITTQGSKTWIASVKVNSQNNDRYKKWKSWDDQRYFTLIWANWETIGTSEMYKTQSARDEGILAVKKYAPLAITEE